MALLGSMIALSPQTTVAQGEVAGGQTLPAFETGWNGAGLTYRVYGADERLGPLPETPVPVLLPDGFSPIRVMPVPQEMNLIQVSRVTAPLPTHEGSPNAAPRNDFSAGATLIGLTGGSTFNVARGTYSAVWNSFQQHSQTEWAALLANASASPWLDPGHRARMVELLSQLQSGGVTAVPEPSALALFGAGLLFLGTKIKRLTTPKS